jgi:hypothetical protein
MEVKIFDIIGQEKSCSYTTNKNATIQCFLLSSSILSCLPGIKCGINCGRTTVAPEKAGDQKKKTWIPACAGMTSRERGNEIKMTLRGCGNHGDCSTLRIFVF